jgi:ketosteroid isomerase-like protein
MHLLRGATAVVSLLAGFALANGAAASPIPDWATEFLESWYSAYNAGDASGVAALFASDAVLGGTDSALIGVMAVAWGHESCLEQSKTSTGTRQTYKRWLRVFAVQMSNRWVITRETFEPGEAP